MTRAGQTVARRRRRAGVLLAAGSTASCALSAGPAVGPVVGPTEGTTTSLGLRLSATVQPARDSGGAFGVEQEARWSLGETRYYSPDQWRFGLLGGFASTPLPYRGRVGFEALCALGLGKFAVGDGVRDAVYAGPRLALPIRFSGAREMWDAEYTVAVTWMLVPFVSPSFLIPLNPGASHELHADLSGGVALRVHTWSSLLP